MVYNAYISSLIRYGIILWGGTGASNRVFLLQKRCLRLIMKASRNSCRGFFKESGLLTVPCIYVLEIATYAWKNKSAWQTGGDVHHYDTRRHRNVIRVDEHRT